MEPQQLLVPKYEMPKLNRLNTTHVSQCISIYELIVQLQHLDLSRTDHLSVPSFNPQDLLFGVASFLTIRKRSLQLVMMTRSRCGV